MIVTHTTEHLRQLLASSEGTVGFVPTMGALHEGHLSLVRTALEQCDTVVVSIFVNPTQFNDKGDLANYPRTPERDLRLLEGTGTDIVFMPGDTEIYPQEDIRSFDLGTLDSVMEGSSRPGHFNGVAQVVSRLFEIVSPDRAYFGEKDFQQVAVIRRLCDLNEYRTEIISCPVVREEDGLAMSSRNALLSAEHRQAAPKIHRSLLAGRAMIASHTPRQVEQAVTGMINSDPLLNTIYFKLVDRRTLLPVNSWDSPDGVQGCVAVQAGSVRLIDNIRFL